MASDDPLMNEPAVPDVPYSAEAIPPEITEVPALPPPQRRHPNFWWSILWVIGFLILTQLLAPLAVLIPVVVFRMFISGTPQEFADRLSDPDFQKTPEFFLTLLLPAMIGSMTAI